MFRVCKPVFGPQRPNLPVGSVSSEENENTESSANMATLGNALVGKWTADCTAHIISKC